MGATFQKQTPQPGKNVTNLLSIKRIVFLDFIHRLVSQEQAKQKKIEKN
jgi:hypothetical protein